MKEEETRDIAVEIFHLLQTKAEVDISIVMSAVSVVLATIAVEAGLDEDTAARAFRQSYGNAQRRLKRVMKEVH